MIESGIIHTVRFEYGHRLTLHPGKCHNLHGHSGKLEVEIAGDIDEKTGMILDFDKVKEIIDKYIDQEFDHYFLANSNDKELINFIINDRNDFRLKHFDFEPTVEKLAEFLFLALYTKLREFYNTLPVTFDKDIGHSKQFLMLKSVRLWETEKNSALISREYPYGHKEEILS